MTYAQLGRKHRKLQNLIAEDDGNTSDAYWELRREFQADLKDVLRDETRLRKLNRTQLYNFIAWCSSYRPHEPHVVLMILGRLRDPPNAD